MSKEKEMSDYKQQFAMLSMQDQQQNQQQFINLNIMIQQDIVQKSMDLQSLQKRYDELEQLVLLQLRQNTPPQ